MSEAFKLAPHEWALLRSLLDEALALPAAKRDAWLVALDESRAHGLKPRLQALLANASDDDPATGVRLLETLPKVETGQFAPMPGASAEKPGDAVGPYRLIRELGSGGMGSVWLAERTDMLQGRQVALKLPHGAWKRAGLAERMAREREILATLEHPHISRLYDAGLAADGQPWLALEYVQGERIDTYCRTKNLSVPARLRLFLQVAQAVAHAHAQLVVHRDLKPANILVTEAGDVKLLDFGIAKLVQEGVVDETELTREAGRVLTPEYASPEQILGKPIGTASDVFSLGVVLFELLADVRPYNLPRTSRAALEEAIAAGDVPRPSVLAPAGRRAALRGDLDTIVIKALKREPAERYATVAAFADDVLRHLDQRPVLAQPDSAAYRLRTLVRRHRVAVAAGAAVAAALLVGTGVSLWQASVARGEQARAEQVKHFLVAMFDGINPESAGPGRSVSAAQVLERAEARLPQGPLRLELTAALVRARLGLHDYPAVLELTRRLANEPVRPDISREDLELAWARAQAFKQLQRLDEAERVLAPLLVATRRDADLHLRARLLEGEIAHQRASYAKARDLALAMLQDAQEARLEERRAQAHLLVAQASSMLRERQAAFEHASAAHAIQGRLHEHEPAHPSLLATGQTLAAALMDEGKHDEAAPLLEDLLGDSRRVYGQDNWLVPEFASRLAIVEAERGQFKRSLALLEESMRASEAVALPDTMAKAGQLRTLARAYMRERRHGAAVPRLDQSLAIIARTPAPQIERVVRADRAFAAAMAGDQPAAQALADLKRIDAEQDAAEARYRTHLPVHYLGRLQALMGEREAALATLRKAEPLARRNTRRVETAEALVDLAHATLDAPTADLTRAATLLDEAQAMLQAARAEALPAAADLALGRARIALAQGRAADALTAARRADEYWRQAAAEGRDAGVAAHWLAQALAANGQRDAARAAQARAAQRLVASPFASDARLLGAQRPPRGRSS